MQSTQRFLNISEIRDNCVILKDGTLLSVVMVSSINFDLKAEDEQNAVISGYVNFLNSIEYPLQIVIQSRKLNVDAYLLKLDKIVKAQTNELLKAQTIDYIKYIRSLLELGEIMTKRFYVVVSYNVFSNKQKGFWTRVMEVFHADVVINLSDKVFKERSEALSLRTNQVKAGLTSLGLQCVVLDTQGLIELYYYTYNLESSEIGQTLKIDKLNVESV